MSFSNNDYINTYIDVIMASINEQLVANLQLKTQLRLSELNAIELQKTVDNYTQLLNEQTANATRIGQLTDELNEKQKSIEEASRKVALIGAYEKQIVSLKEQCLFLQGELDKLSKKPTKKKVIEFEEAVTKEITQDGKDDF